MKRRVFLVSAGALAMWPRGAVAQRAKPWRVGFLSGRNRPASLDIDAHGAFLRGMRDLGHAEGTDYVMEWRFAGGDFSRLHPLAAELVEAKVDIIVTSPAQATKAAQDTTRTIPIVFAYVSNPVASGFVASLARPGANITGLSVQLTDVAPKQIELLQEVVPGLTRVAVLSNPANAGSALLADSIHAAVENAGLILIRVTARNPQETEAALAAARGRKAGAMITVPDPFFASQRHRIAEMALTHGLPTIFGDPDYVSAGGLLSYGEPIAGFFHRAAYYVDRILKGTNPADLPVEQPRKFNLTVSLKTAEKLGLTIPISVIARADEVIE